MVDTNSPAFKTGEKIGFIIGKMIRLAAMAGVTVILARYLNRAKLPITPKPNTNPPNQ